MAESGRLDEFKRKFDENPRRYFAPLANEYRKAGDVERAIELCRTYLPQQPSHMSGYIVYGQALFDAGRTDEAAAVFKQALTLDPENIIALRYLGDIARSEGDNAGAMRWYGKVLDLDPRNEEIAGYITALASPGARPIPRNERAAPPAIRPEPAFDASAVALAQLVAEPDKHQTEMARAAAPAPAESVEHQPTTEPARQDESEAEREPLIIFEESFEVISWPMGATGAPESGVHGDTAADPVRDQVSEMAAEAEHGIGGEKRTSSFADFVPDEPAPLAPDMSSFFEVTSLLHRTVAPVTGAESDEHDETHHGHEPERPGTDSPFVTETMAELYVQQGLAEDALVIYRQLVLRRADPRLHERIAELEGRGVTQPAQAAPEAAAKPAPQLAPEAAPEATAEAALEPESAAGNAPKSETAREPARETVREFFARIGAVTARAHPHLAPENETGLASIFGSATDHPDDLSAAQSLAGAFGSARSDSSGSRV